MFFLASWRVFGARLFGLARLRFRYKITCKFGDYKPEGGGYEDNDKRVTDSAWEDSESGG